VPYPKLYKMEFTHAFISDLHCGSLYFDLLAFNKVVGVLEHYKIRVRNLHVLGDVVEGKMNHRGQLYEAFPIDIQEEIAIKVLSKLIDLLKPKRLFIIAGNHDRKHGINLLDRVVSEIERKYSEIELHYYRDNDYYVYGSLLCLHGLSGFRGSDYLGLTPQLMNNVIGLVQMSGRAVKKIVMGHYHRFVNVTYLGYDIYALPSFQYSDRPLRMERGMLFIDDSGLVWKLMERATERSALIEWWRKAFRI